ncbi:unannotated protein [freshwater metagenome]|uniref:Unannotated protein n=1 Tax=freshwater metagenome TaxID=449393 RepID=A0A6J7KK46_9ZZZZ
MREFVGAIGEKQLREAVVAGAHCEARVAVIRLNDREDLALLRGVPRRFQRDVDGLATARAVDDLGQRGRGRGDQRLGQCGASEGRKVVVTDVKVLHCQRDGLHDLRVAVPETVGAPVEVHVDQALSRHVVEEVLLAPVDDQRHPGVTPELGLARVPVLLGLFEHLFLRAEGKRAVVEGRRVTAASRHRDLLGERADLRHHTEW